MSKVKRVLLHGSVAVAWRDPRERDGGAGGAAGRAPAVGRPEHSENHRRARSPRACHIPSRACVARHRCAGAPQSATGTPSEGRYGTSGGRQAAQPAGILRRGPQAPTPSRQAQQKTRRPHGRNPVIPSGLTLDGLAPAHRSEVLRRPRSPRRDTSGLILIRVLSTAAAAQTSVIASPPRCSGREEARTCRFTSTAPSGRPSAVTTPDRRRAPRRVRWRPRAYWPRLGTRAATIKVVVVVGPLARAQRNIAIVPGSTPSSPDPMARTSPRSIARTRPGPGSRPPPTARTS